MITGFSKAVILYLTPLLALAAILLSLFSFLAPSFLFNDKVALLTVTPSEVLLQNAGGKDIDGPSIFMGVLGSCSRPKNDAPMNCTSPAASAIYDLSALPNNAPRVLLTSPNASVPFFIGIGISMSITFFIFSTLIAFRHKMGKAGSVFDKPILMRLSTWIGVIGFVLGLASFVILRIYFGKTVEDFNGSIKATGDGAPALVANTGNAFTMVWVAYAFYAVPVISSLTRMDATLLNKA